MANTNKDSGLLIMLAGVVLLFLYLSKPRGNSLTTASPSASTGAGCCDPCGKSHGAPRTNVTTPVNPAVGTTTATGSTLTQAAAGTAVSDYAGPSAPGSNASAPGSGANWQGLRQQRRSSLTPSSAPHSPIAAVGWMADATVTAVSQ